MFAWRWKDPGSGSVPTSDKRTRIWEVPKLTIRIWNTDLKTNIPSIAFLCLAFIFGLFKNIKFCHNFSARVYWPSGTLNNLFLKRLKKIENMHA
jgi:hypothetical protein